MYLCGFKGFHEQKRYSVLSLFPLCVLSPVLWPTVRAILENNFAVESVYPTPVARIYMCWTRMKFTLILFFWFAFLKVEYLKSPPIIDFVFPFRFIKFFCFWWFHLGSHISATFLYYASLVFLYIMTFLVYFHCSIWNPLFWFHFCGKSCSRL